jgi:ADP-ribosyl-[dinitrogen reductase] hydrolase
MTISVVLSPQNHIALSWRENSMIRTSCTHPLRIDAIPVSAGRLGLTFCPGKQGDSLNGAPWARDLEADLVALREWGADQVVTLMERHEFSVLRVPDLDARVVAHGMTWTHLPIPDQDVPKAAFEAAWPQVRATLLSNLHAGSSVVLHCRGGLGRTGLVAALILIETGMAAEKAIQAVRSLRPRAIETAAQERYVLNYRPGPVQKNCP